MVTSGFKCDCNGCPSVKTEANGWFIAVMWTKSCLLLHWNDASEEEIAKGAHLCGSACALKAISEWMSK